MDPQRIGHYEIRRKLGAGGMGEVFQATDTRLGRDVALKILPDSFAADAARMARFEREARVLASLNHPNIATLHGIEESDGKKALVMELVPGEDLSQRIGRGALPIEEALGVAVQIARALEAAHHKGVVHRDLKPANVRLTTDGQVKVLDFGLAKPSEAEAAGDADLSRSPTLTQPATQMGVVLGTAAYMSPEQARGKPVDARSDVFSFGCLLFEMLSGSRAFGGEDLSEVLASVIKGDVRWDRLPRSVPEPLRRIVTRCLEGRVEQRYQAIGDARIDLAELQADPAALSPPGRPPPALAGPRAWIATATAIAALALTAAIWILRPAAPGLPVRVVQVAGGDDLERVAISPDGRRLAIERKGRLYVRALDDLIEREIPAVHDVEPSAVWWSPDDRRILYATHDEIYTVAADGGAPDRVCEIPRSARSDGTLIGATWWGADRLVFAIDVRGLWQVPARGGEPSLLLAPNSAEQERAFHMPSVLPDGKTLAFRVRSRESDFHTIGFLRDGVRTDVQFPEWRVSGPIVGDGRLLFSGKRGPDSGLWAVPFSSSDLSIVGEAVRFFSGQSGTLSMSDDGALVYMDWTDSASELAILDRSGAVVGRYGEVDRDPAVSPDGRMVAVAGVAAGVRIFDGNRTISVGEGWGPSWSPDGRELIYGTSQGLVRVPADGSRRPETIYEGSADTPDWSRDGRYVTFTLVRDREGAVSDLDAALGRTHQGDIAVMRLEGERKVEAFRPSPENERHPRFSPDGRFLAYVSDESGTPQVYVSPFPAGDRRWQVSVQRGQFPRWSPGGDEIYFVDGSNLMAARLSAGTDVVIGAPERLLSSTELAITLSAFGQSYYDVTPQGQFAVRRDYSRAPRRAILIQNWPKLLERHL